MARAVVAQEKKSKNLREEKQMCSMGPDVIVDFIFDDGLLFVSIWNIGDKPAYKVRVKFDQKIVGVEGRKVLSFLPLFRVLEFLAPHKQIKTFLDSSASYFERGQPTSISISVSFTDSQGQKFTNIIKHNLEIYRDIGYIRKRENAF